jgi:hypothetical protein
MISAYSEHDGESAAEEGNWSRGAASGRSDPLTMAA